jgi:nicotinamidase-related amidase
MRICAENTMTIVVDYQERLMPVINEKEEIIRNSVKLLTGLDILGVPCIVSQQYPKGLGETIPAIREVTSQAVYYDKTSFSCYGDTAIKDAINAQARRNVILCGVEAHICVLQTAIDLRDAGFQTILVTDCIGSRKADDKKYGIKRAMHEGVILATYESVLFELTSDAKNQAFKSIANLVNN